MSSRLIQVGNLVSVGGKGSYRVIEIRPSLAIRGRNAPKVKDHPHLKGFLHPNICKILSPLNLENE